MPGDWIHELNPAQREAATHPGGPLLIIAGAGTGKTKTLASRVAWLLEQGVAPDRILLLTFTRRAAAEMVNRAQRLTGLGTAGRVWGGTFHAMANRLLRQFGRGVGLAPEFTVMDQSDAADLMGLIRSDLLQPTGGTRRRFPQKGTLIDIYSRVVNSRTPLKQVLKRHYPWCEEDFEGLRRIFEEYTRRKRQQSVLDYDDLLLYWHLLCQVPTTGEIVAGLFEHLLVDEYQDTNPIQAEILRAMRRTRPDITVVGDDAQAIYSFRAATVRNILDFPVQFPGAAVVKLEQNYRSLQPILDASNAMMAGAKERFTKELFSERPGARKPAIVTCMDEQEQCGEVCDRVLRKREEGVMLRHQAVLFRAGHHSDVLEVELTRRNIPFVKYGGLKFVEAAHVKDMVAFLRILENPADEMSWFRVLQLLDGIGPANARGIIQALLAPGDDLNPLARLTQSPPVVPAAAQAEFDGLREALTDCAAPNLPPAAQVERIRKFYDPVFRRVYDNPVVRLRDLDQLEQIAGRYPSRRQFITDLALDPPNSTQDLAGPPLLDEDFLILSTIHSAKGCEWDAVHVIHVADGMIPSDMATGSDEEIEEERRLLYVAMTRARDELNLYFPLRYYDRARGRGDRHSYAQLTRFISPKALSLFEQAAVGHGSQPAPADRPAPAFEPADALEKMLGALWEE